MILEFKKKESKFSCGDFDFFQKMPPTHSKRNIFIEFVFYSNKQRFFRTGIFRPDNI